jgi:hypothetical protein
MDFTTDATSTPPEKDTSFRNYSGALQKKMLSAQLLKGRWNSIFCFSTQWYFYLKVICDETLWARGLRNKSWREGAARRMEKIKSIERHNEVLN